MHTFAALTWHGPTGTAHTCTYPHRTPILTARSGEVSLWLSAGDEHAVTVAELRFARQLADAAAQYVRECERFLVEGPAERGAA